MKFIKSDECRCRWGGRRPVNPVILCGDCGLPYDRHNLNVLRVITHREDDVRYSDDTRCHGWGMETLVGEGGECDGR